MSGSGVTGAAELLAKLERLRVDAPKAASAGGMAWAQRVMARSQALVPIDTGELKASGYVRLGPGGKVEIGYSAPYALAVHERLNVRHRQGQAKYLEAAVDAERPSLKFTLIGALKALVKGP